MRRSLFFCLAWLLASFTACSSDTPKAAPGLGPIYAGDASDVFVPADGGETDAGTEGGAVSPVAPAAKLCPDVTLPEASSPAAAIRALTLTDTRIYVGREDGLYAFTRQAGCAAERVSAFETTETALPVLALAAGTGDSVLVARAGELVLIGADGQRLGNCSSETVVHLSTVPANGQGIAVLGTEQLATLGFDAQGCSTAPLEFSATVAAILAASADPESAGSFVLGVERTLTAPPTLTRLPAATLDATGPCSITGLAPAGANVAVLDPACRAVRFINVEADTEPFLHLVGASAVGRALAAVPESQGTEVVLGTADQVTSKPQLWVLTTPSP